MPVSPLSRRQAARAAERRSSLPQLLAVGIASAVLGFGLVFCLGGGLERYASPNDGEAETTASPTSEEPAENSAAEDEQDAGATEEPADQAEQTETLERLSGQDSEPQEGTSITALTPEEQYQANPFTTTHAESSSFLQSSQWAQYYYGPECVMDGNLSTGWCEGSDTVGIGEWVSINADGEQWVRGVRIVNGHPRREDVYFRNCRVKGATIQLSDGFEMHVTLDDLYNDWQAIDFGGYHQTSYIRLTIDSVYEGSEWTDTLVSEMVAY